MRTAIKLTLTLACLVLACAPTSALAKNTTHAPPGNSGVQEYLEVVPGGGGNRPAAKLKRSPHALNGKARGALGSYGRDGRAAANLAEVTSDPAGRGGSGSGRSGTKGGKSAGGKNGAASLSAKDSGSGDSGVLGALKRVATRIGGDGLGVGLPLLLLVVLVGGVLLARRRRGQSSES
jgi:hypothetical protein